MHLYAGSAQSLALPVQLAASSQFPIDWQHVALAVAVLHFAIRYAPIQSADPVSFRLAAFPHAARRTFLPRPIGFKRGTAFRFGASATAIELHGNRRINTHQLANDTPASEAPQLVGRLGPWQLVKPLGEGNLTRVYLARPADGPQNQPAAYVVKVLRKEWWRDPTGHRHAAARSLGREQSIAPEFVAGVVGQRRRAAILRRARPNSRA